MKHYFFESSLFLTHFSVCASEPLEVTAAYPVDALPIQSLVPTCKQSVNVTWMPPAIGEVDSYFVECRSSLDVLNATVGTSSMSVVLGPLVGETEYTCSVSAVNAFGVGPSSPADPFMTS